MTGEAQSGSFNWLAVLAKLEALVKTIPELRKFIEDLINGLDAASHVSARWSPKAPRTKECVEAVREQLELQRMELCDAVVCNLNLQELCREGGE
jgi:hypothetical protein